MSRSFTADPSPHARYTWLFGDGTEAHGRHVSHTFSDAEGTELDGASIGAGRFRVLLHVELPATQTSGTGQSKQNAEPAREDWAAQGVVAVRTWDDAVSSSVATTHGLVWKIYPGSWTELPDLSTQQAVFSGESLNLQADPQGFTRYVATWDGFIDVPADGGYTFYLIDRDGARLVIDGVPVAKTGPPFAQVCGSPGNALRYDRGTIGLRAGKHIFHLEGLHSLSQGEPQLLWEGPALRLTTVPPAAYLRSRQDAKTK
jgi:hypothetical protein